MTLFFVAPHFFVADSTYIILYRSCLALETLEGSY